MINFKGYRILVSEVGHDFYVVATNDFNSFEFTTQGLNYFEAIAKAKRIVNETYGG